MSRIIAAINMTLDGFCDHTAMVPDEEIHQHYAALLNSGDAVLYGRITYQLMTYWRDLLKNPTGDETMDGFATAIDKIPKIVFSHTLKPGKLGWESAKLSNRTPGDEVLELRQQNGKDIFIGCRSLILQLLNLHLIDELQLCIHPVIAGSGLPLFEIIRDRTILKLINTKTFTGGAVILYYEPQR